MVRWSRRWASGELSKDQLHEILEEVSKKKDWPTGSVEQLIGDHYASAVDEARIDALGTKPVEPWLAEIEKMKSAADVQKMIGRFHDAGVSVPFALFGGSDKHEPNEVIANVYASGLGLPDRQPEAERIAAVPAATTAALESGVVETLGFSPQSDAPSCADCGAIMIRNGSCYKCLNCGATSGCS